MREGQCLYHLTSLTKWKEIKKTGLKPLIGENGRLCAESRPTIFLSDHHSIPFWQILLEADVLLKIHRKDLQEEHLVDETEYNGYKEYGYLKPIPMEQIQRIPLASPKQEIRETLCRNYLWMLSNTVRECADYYNGRGGYAPEMIRRNLKVITGILSRLDYKTCDSKRIIKEIRAMGEEGEYVFTDQYKESKERLWSQLIRYPKDSLSEDRRKLYEQIRRSFTYYQRTLPTGGYTTE